MNVTKEWFKEHGFNVIENDDKIIVEKAKFIFNERVSYFRWDYVFPKFPKEDGNNGFYLLYAINNTSNIKVECCFTEKPFSVATIEGVLNLIGMNY